MSNKTGGCLCGAVRFTLSNPGTDFTACHCEMCRRWAGSALLAFTVPRDSAAIEGAENIATIQSSEWAERAWCRSCGSGLWYRLTLVDQPDELQIPVGLLDDASGLTFSSEIFIDCKPDSYAYAGTRNTMTRAEVFAKYAPSAEET